MTAVKKITEAENILIKLRELSSNKEFQLEVGPVETIPKLPYNFL
jgi:hypothetical protein